jgi:hypothetical protein
MAEKKHVDRCRESTAFICNEGLGRKAKLLFVPAPFFKQTTEIFIHFMAK